jgi:hypothetical protein
LRSGAKRSSDPRIVITIGLVPLQGLPVPTAPLFTTTTRNTYLATCREAGFALCRLALKLRSWHDTAQQMRTRSLAKATLALRWPIPREHVYVHFILLT